MEKENKQKGAFIAKTKIHTPSLRFYKDMKTERGSPRPYIANCCEVVFDRKIIFEHEKEKLLSSFGSEDRWTGLIVLMTRKIKIKKPIYKIDNQNESDNKSSANIFACVITVSTAFSCKSGG